MIATPEASEGPRFVTVMVNETASPFRTGTGAFSAMGPDGIAVASVRPCQGPGDW